MDRKFNDIFLELSVLQDHFYTIARDDYMSFETDPNKAWLLDYLMSHKELIEVVYPTQYEIR